MKRTMLIVVICLAALGASTDSAAQSLGGRKVAGPVTYSGGLELHQGDTLHLVQGSGASGQFTFVYSLNTGVPVPMSATYAGHAVVVDHFRSYRGEQPVPVVLDRKVWYLVDVVNGVRSGELKVGRQETEDGRK